MNQLQQATVQVTREFDTSPDLLFHAWLDKDTLGKWLFKTPNGVMTRVELETYVGGTFCIVERRDGKDVEHFGEYRAIKPPNQLRFNFWVNLNDTPTPPVPHVTQVTIDISPLGEDGAQLTLTHDQVQPDYAGKVEDGWRMILNNLALMLAQHSFRG